MRVARVMAPRQIRLEESPVPSLGPGEALVRIKAVGICGSDLQYYAQGRIGDLQFTAGHILGHEVAGVVEELGPGVEGPSAGTRVVVDPAIHCGRCRFCMEGSPNFCTNLRFFGSPPIAGALREFIVHPTHLLLPLAPSTPFPVAAIIEPLGVAIYAVDLGHLKVGCRVAIFGCGPIGILASRVAQLSGATVVCATEPLPHRRKAALQYGATAVFDPGTDEVVRAIREVTHGEGVDVAFEMAGSQSATEQALEVLRPGGTVVLVGYWNADQVTLPGIRAMRKGLTLRFVRRMKNTFERAIELAQCGLVDLKGLVSHEFCLDDVVEAFARAEKRAPDVLKTVITL